jgi:putative glycosyltransferase (TIGR04372 family)
MLYNRFELLLLIPHPTAVGNCAEEILESLKIAAARQKKVLVLLPILINNVKYLTNTINPQLFNIESNFLLIRPLSKILFPFRLLIWLLFAPFIILSYFVNLLGPKFGLNVSLRNFYPYFGTFLLYNVIKESKVTSFDLESTLVEHKLRHSIPSMHINLHNDLVLKTQDFRKSLHLLPTDWFVCLHVRTSGFYTDELNQSERNADINNYIELINYIIDKGGWVFRLGDSSMPKIDNRLLISTDRLVDLPFSDFNTAQFNAWLISNCNTYIGMQSGPLDLARLFGKPIIIVNMYVPFFAICNERNMFGVYKRFYDKFSSKQLTPTQILLDYDFDTSNLTLERAYSVELSPKEILDFCAPLLPFKLTSAVDFVSKKELEFQNSILTSRILQNKVKGKMSDQELTRWLFRSIYVID